MMLMLALQVEANPADTTRTPRWYVPHYVPIQYAGNTGFLSTGAGFASRKQNYYLDLLYGYVPRSIGGVAIHTVSVKNYFPFGHFEVGSDRSLVPYAGLGLSVEVSGHAFFTQPSHFPDGYYQFPKNLHLLAYGGVRMQHLFTDDERWLRGVDLYAEAGTVDVYLWYKTMSRQIKMTNILSLALGVNLRLHR